MLESIYFVLYGHGFREEREEELIRFDTNGTAVSATFGKNGREDAFEIDIRYKAGKVTKTYFVNKTSKRRDFYTKDLVKAVLFTPDQINIIKGSPSLRRDYFNRLLSVFDLDYKKKLTNYEMALRRRNKVLEKHTNITALKGELKFWDEYLIKESKYLVEKRGEYVKYLNGNKKLDSKEFSIEYLKNEFTQPRLDESFEKERIIRKTMIGPQKDDFLISVSNGILNKNVHHYASRSEERLAVFWLKLNEVKFFESTGDKPILLLDDIFSELDLDNKKIVLGLVENYQTVATTTEEGLMKEINAEKKVIDL
jgi:DNA replication and repair protein RecF